MVMGTHARMGSYPQQPSSSLCYTRPKGLYRLTAESAIEKIYHVYFDRDNPPIRPLVRESGLVNHADYKRLFGRIHGRKPRTARKPPNKTSTIAKSMRWSSGFERAIKPQSDQRCGYIDILSDLKQNLRTISSSTGLCS
jgi:hypothetical protein